MSSIPPPISNVQDTKSLNIGCMVVNIKDIHQNLHDPFPGRPNDYDGVHIKPLGVYRDTEKSNKISKLRSILVDIFAVSRQQQKKSESTLSAPECERHFLKNYQSWFDEQCGKPRTRDWLIRVYNSRENVYLIVGLLVLKDARLVVESAVETARARQAQPSLPVGFAFLENFNLMGGVRWTKDNTRSREGLFEVPGRSIFGIWYRKVKFQWLNSRDIESSPLSPNTRWKPLWEWRGDEDEEDEEDEAEAEDTIDVSLEDESDWESDDDPDGDGNHCLKVVLEPGAMTRSVEECATGGK